ncbi:hypothetical protein KIN20_003222 [Parelaphostrongylus tenuis]|uniref:Uncharacterized protein n=1 Tax=Parelaphostrongylus tenuis TaxID=148309 RepID=A0AAD5MPM5_PARTN|nr:hypothetical protein KIN20_003222 [Parelaphostrongylus tenuis]
MKWWEPNLSDGTYGVGEFDMARVPIDSFMILVLVTITTALGCGVIPSGQASTRNFTVTGFTLPVNMVYSSDANIRVKASGIAASKEAVQTFVSRLLMQTVFDVLEQQARNALLPDAIIANILGQLTVQVRYEPLECKEAAVNHKPTDDIMGDMNKQPHCIIAGSTVTALCVVTTARDNMCNISTNMRIGAISANYTTISGTLTTTNMIMANWSKDMWQGVVNRAIRMLSSRPFGSHFFSAFATVA